MSQAADSIDFSQLSRGEIQNVLAKYHIRLTIDEVLTIQNQLLKRPVTIAECVLWSIQGSEHCSYKSSRIHLNQLITQAPHVILGPKEDAGVVAVATDNAGYRYGIVMSHESHNHPSQIVPYEGAATGVGGNIRDVCCMGAEVIAIADGLRFGDINRAKTHWVSSGVIRGIAGYGNPIGIPNIAGDVYFDAEYNENCLVTVVTLGVVRDDHLIHSHAPADANEDYRFILVGKPTDNSGFGGASFASSNLTVDEIEKNKGAVQEPNAFLQRHILKASYALFKILQQKNLIHKVGFKDLGAGGVACASVELAESIGLGAEIEVDAIPTSMSNLSAPVILCSETQERFMWVVHESLVPLILTHYNETYALPVVSHGACAKVIGKIRKDGRYVVRYQGETIVDANASDVTKGILYQRAFSAKKSEHSEPKLSAVTDYNEILLRLLSHENIASRAPIFEMYDKQVQGRTLLDAGEADAGILQPFNDDQYPDEIRQVGIALSLDQNPRFNMLDPYWGAVNAVVETMRNVAAVGATPIGLTDCLCFGNPEKAEQMYEFVEAVKGITAVCEAFHLYEYPDASIPVISGNVSLYNESNQGAIPPSPMMSCLGRLADCTKHITPAFKAAGNVIIMIGERKDECGGSVFYQLYNELGANIPQPDLKKLSDELHTLYDCAQSKYIQAAHDISEGGIAVAITEMSIKNQIGVNVLIESNLPLEKILFSETGGFVLEVLPQFVSVVLEKFNHAGVYARRIGLTIKEPILKINQVIQLATVDAKNAFENGLRNKLL